MADHDEYHPPNVLCEHCLAKFLFDQQDFVTSLHGQELTRTYAALHGFSNPIKVEHVNGLELQVPVVNYDHFLNRLGDDRMVEVIHIEEDVTTKMSLKDFIGRVTKPEENTYCMQSLELTSTEMKNEVSPPSFARSIDLIEHAWSPCDEESESTDDEPESTDDESEEDNHNPELNGLKPEVNRFLQINMAGSYINFHLDASGSGIWHHVLRGTEVLYLIKGPVEKIASKYEEWYLKTYLDADSDTSMHSESDSHSSMNDDDELEFHRVEVSEGETIFLPGGFFRAMRYPVETIVVGGNYLNLLNVHTHLRLYHLESEYGNNRRLRQSIMFPKFAEACWRFAHKTCKIFIGPGMFSFSHCIFDQLKCLSRYLSAGHGFEKVSKKLKKIGTSNILYDLEFILDNAIPDPNNEGDLILDSEGYDPSSF